ncbi:hypothetical protein AB0Q95_40155 [Streptomyces sp. NPDC059900]|uniref:hypothetical protein n=1 Tax=Streptomyces sp. NPDC059900 TaxID=3155816 RepID=UPI00343268E0
MTESAHLYMANPRITVLGVNPGRPPFRIVELDGEVVGEARELVDVLEVAAQVGHVVDDVDDPDQVRWVGGDKFTWKPKGPSGPDGPAEPGGRDEAADVREPRGSTRAN